MEFVKKSLGQNFLIDKNIIKKIIKLVPIKKKNIIEIGPGKGALTNEIMKKEPKSLLLIEKDNRLSKTLENEFKDNKKINIINQDVLNFDFKKVEKKSIIFGNLPYNISSQILVKIIKIKELSSMYSDIIFMFQKELGEKIIANYPSSNYGRISILSSYKLNTINKFYISSNCFFPKPKVQSMVIHFQPKKKLKFKIHKIENLEKITNIFFSNRRKMINKNLYKLLNKEKIKSISNLNFNLRPEAVSPEFFYKITNLYES